MKPGGRGPGRGARALGAAVEVLGTVAPRRGLRWAARLGAALAAGPGGWRIPTESEVTELLGPLAPERLAHVRREIASQELRNHVLRRLMTRRGLEALAPLIEEIHAEPLRRALASGPVVVVGWHQGPAWVDPVALARLGLPVLSPSARAELPAGEAGAARVVPLARDGSDAAFLARAQRALAEEGYVVALNLDWRRARGVAVEVLGRQAWVGGGAAWLARRTGARLVPVTRRFRGEGPGIAVAFHEALPEPGAARADGPAWDAALLATAAAWFDAWLRRHPGTLRLPRLRHLTRQPRAASTASVRP